MFLRSLLVSSALLTLVGGVLTVALLQDTADDRTDYAKHVATPTALPNDLAAQYRSPVRKEVWHVKEPHLGYQLDCDHSTVEWVERDGAMQMVETMQTVRGLLQEELFYITPFGEEIVVQADGSLRQREATTPRLEHLAPTADWKPMQVVRAFEAEQALLTYRSQELVAKEVTMCRCRLPGHLLAAGEPLEVSLKGTADTLTVCLGADGKFAVNAKRLRASLPSWHALK